MFFEETLFDINKNEGDSQDHFINDKFTIDELLQRSWNYKSSDEFIQFFDFISRFNHYSRYNSMLVYIQDRAVTFFGGSSYWRKKFNRTIKPDARPYIILAPKGPVLLVYDIFETEGRESPEEFLENGLGRKPFGVAGTIQEKKYKSALSEARAWGIPIKIKPLSYFNAGYIESFITGDFEIILKEGRSNEENVSVLIHELAHLFLGHTLVKSLSNAYNEKTISLPQRRELSKSARELEAESVSFLICKKLGLETRSAEYIAGYIKSSDDLIHFSYENVIKTADRIEKLFFDI